LQKARKQGIIPTLFLCLLQFCYLQILLHFLIMFILAATADWPYF